MRVLGGWGKRILIHNICEKLNSKLKEEPLPSGNRLWIHITDVGHFLKKESRLDEEALGRASSIYTPDKRIPMDRQNYT